ncbi:MAG TPA: hypothetical protein VEW65_06410, partial [Chryseolinea sp.]|nr:hypothetical protein [Chryseolinea sp.]
MSGSRSSFFFNNKRGHFPGVLWITLVATSLFFHNAASQDATIDSLKKILPDLRDTARVNCLNRISAAYTKFLMWEACYKQLDSARSYALLARREATTLDYRSGVALAYENLGELECEGGMFNKGEPFLRQAAELYDSLNRLADLNWVRITLAWSLSPQGKSTEARQILLKAAAYYRSVSNIMLESRTYRMIGNTYAEQGYFLKAFDYTQKAYEMRREPGDTFGHLFSPQRKGDLFLINEDTTTAIKYYQESVAYAKSNGLTLNYLDRMLDICFLVKKYDSAFYFLTAYTNHVRVNFDDPAIQKMKIMSNANKLGQLYMIFGRTDDAIRVLQSAAVFFKGVNNIIGLLNVLNTLASAYDEQLNNGAALNSANQMIEFGLETGKRNFAMDGYRFLWRAYDREHNLPLAYDAHIKYSQLKEEIESDQYKQKIAIADWIEKEKELEAELYILDRDNEVKKEQLRTQLLIRKILLGGLVGFTLLGVILFRNLSLKRRNEKLQNEKKQTALEKQATELEMQTL